MTDLVPWTLARFGLVAAAPLMFSCAPASANLPSARYLQSVFAEAIERGPGTTVSLDVVITGEWRHLYVFGPYTPEATIERCVGQPVRDYGISGRDNINLLVLVPDRGPARTRAVSRQTDFSSEAVGRAYPRGAATFAVLRRSRDGTPQLVPASGLVRQCEGAIDSVVTRD